MQSLKTEIGAEIRDPAGNLVQTIPFRRCHSLVKQFIQLLAVQMSQTSKVIKDTGGVNRSVVQSTLNFKANTTAETTWGVVIGSGEAAAVTMEDYKLESQLTTNIAHQTVTFATENPDASTWRLAVSRGFLNDTGSTVNVKEVGFYVYGGSYKTCIDRTLYSVSFATSLTLTLTYRITITL